MLIVNQNHTGDEPTLDRLLRDWWAELQARLWPERKAKARTEEDAAEPDGQGSLLL